MRIGAIIQARMTSRRLPGKVLADVKGRPMLQYLMERVERCSELDLIVVRLGVSPVELAPTLNRWMSQVVDAFRATH